MARRGCLRIATLALMGLAGGSAVRAAAPRAAERRLSFYNTHTRERVDVAYWAEGRYVPEALARIDRVLRDHRTGAVQPIDRRLLELLHTLRVELDVKGPFHVISGYRSPESNAYLRGLSPTSGVAQKSQHMLGRAIDIRIPGVPIASIRRAAVAMQKGGVGFYPASDFVHVDVGRVRTW